MVLEGENKRKEREVWQYDIRLHSVKWFSVASLMAYQPF